MSVQTAMTAIADKIRAILGISGTMGLNAMATNLNTVQTDIDGAYTAVGNQGGTVPDSKVSGGLAAAINSIPLGVTVQRKTGTFTTSGSEFAVDVGFRPDLVMLHAGEISDDGIKLHTAAAFYEDKRNEFISIQTQLVSANGSYMFYIRPTSSGFAGNSWYIDSSHAWNEYTTAISYTAVKYT